MPQFDFDCFSTQIFWSLSGFFIFYFLVLRYYVVLIGEALKFRSKLTSFYSIKGSVEAFKSPIYDKILLGLMTSKKLS
jgi:succinate dehydrogenase/fumarate reductase cytochrome b subunit